MGQGTPGQGRRDSEVEQIFSPEWSFFGQVKTLGSSLQPALQNGGYDNKPKRGQGRPLSWARKAEGKIQRLYESFDC